MSAIRSWLRNQIQARVLVAGCGYVGIALGERLAAGGCEVFGLRRRVADADDAPVEVLADLAAQEDVVAGAHRLAQVVVEPLFGIGIARVELAQAGVGHRRLVSHRFCCLRRTRSDRPADFLTNSSGPEKSKLL